MKNPVFKGAIITLLFFCVNTTFSQNSKKVDSLSFVYHNLQKNEGTVTMELLYSIISNHSNSDSILYFAEKLISLAKLESEAEFHLKGHYYKGIAYKRKGDYHKALEAFFKSIQIANTIDCENCIATIYLAIGDSYSNSKNSNTNSRGLITSEKNE